MRGLKVKFFTLPTNQERQHFLYMGDTEEYDLN